MTNTLLIKPAATRLQFSSNRGGARHRVRYVESSAPPPGHCGLCVGSLADQPGRPGVSFRGVRFCGPLMVGSFLPLPGLTVKRVRDERE